MRVLARTAPLLVALAISSRAAAADPVDLVWNAPAGCPSRDAVLAEVGRILGGPSSRRMGARADVTEVSASHFSLHLTTDLEGAQGERTLDADSCASLAQAAALILAWTLDPTRARTAVAAPSAPPAAPSAPSPPPPPSPPPSPGPSEPFAVVVAASGAADVNTLPSLAGGVEATLGALLGPVRVEVSGTDWATQGASKPVQGGATDQTTLHVLDATLRGCFRGRLGERFELDPCLGGGFVYASSVGVASSTFQAFEKSGIWAALRGDVIAAWRLIGPLALRASLGVGVPLSPPAFVALPVDPSQSPVILHQPASFFGRAAVGVEARFP
jgi:hypothetical protein